MMVYKYIFITSKICFKLIFQKIFQQFHILKNYTNNNCGKNSAVFVVNYFKNFSIFRVEY